ncbi:ferritin-like domain-containing protein [Marinilongibacter aquaticus]|uniref:ferritin-like domain-containing protein n=1 Tax=Marinilongibacter aquaticus TaxID=2975157 RepID=UPI0021BD8AEC|nr:ferritin-like domain-containing protein [Marinilongibacter aquaticus]UBM57243.1 ferritin-like domain-containing protein [Marinilongibacter aquaticus]
MKKQSVKVHYAGGFKNRRQFLKISGLTLASAGVLAACKDDNNDMPTPDPDPETPFDLGEGDLGVLNYAYALEQLEADFYTKVVNSFYSGISDDEKQVLTDLYNHEVNHREFFKAALTAATSGDTDLITPELEFDYGGLDFSDRAQVLGTAKVLEDTGVAAYNGAGYLITNADYLLIAGKIVSVEARHASAIRSLLNPDSADFSGDDVVDGNGLDQALAPSVILAAVAGTGFVKTEFTANKLP